MAYLVIGIVVYIAIKENRYVQRGSARCQYDQTWPSGANTKIIPADMMTPIDKIISVIIWMYAACILIFLWMTSKCSWLWIY